MEGGAETTGETSTFGGTDMGRSSPESVGGADFDGIGGASGDVGGSAGDADGAPEAGADGETTAEGDTGGEAVVQSPACAIAHPGGVVNHPLTSGGRAREYRLFVPDSYDGATRLPVMFNLHGTGGNAAGQDQDSGMERLAQEEGFIVIGLQGLQNSWNVLMSDPNAVDDVQYTSDVLDDALQKVCVDERKVYATGFSTRSMTSVAAPSTAALTRPAVARASAPSSRGSASARSAASSTISRAAASDASTAPACASACGPSGRLPCAAANAVATPIAPPSQTAATPTAPCQKPGRAR
jgi:poly(3-hydroxybutyrate) depolymerase